MQLVQPIARRHGWHQRRIVVHNVSRLYSSLGTAPARLDFAAIDAKWQRKWAQQDSQASAGADFNGNVTKEKAYILPMFPYPSGTLHLGHLRVYTISDVIARYKRMRGHDVIHPMGWDAFGLPAENAAIERGVDPAEWTYSNIAKMKEQLKAMGTSFDWGRELTTCNPSFYKHTQKLFLMLYDSNMAYRAESWVNFDPIDVTVLANEQVDSNGLSWRSGAKVEKRLLSQWFLRIKAFQRSLLADLESMQTAGDWPSRVLTQQQNWIGHSRGSQITFGIKAPRVSGSYPVEVFTTRLDTIFGVQYLALSLNHKIVQGATKKFPEVKAFVEAAQNFTPDSKAGCRIPDLYVENPASVFDPSLKESPIPVFAAPYVLDEYGSGAVMGVPGHDKRDFAFWKANSDEAAKFVIETTGDPKALSSEQYRSTSVNQGRGPVTGKGILNDACGPFTGLDSDQAIDAIREWLCILNEEAKVVQKENWRLRDWLISRQRYWGCPIPIVHCHSCGMVPVPDSDLPVELPKLKQGQLTGKGGNPLDHITEWVETSCPKCQRPAKRETDTMDTFMDSSWYMFRFLAPNSADTLTIPEIADAKMPVDLYIGGVEHAILHLLYARFISKFLAFQGLWPSGGGDKINGEPFKRLISQGMVHGKTFSDPQTGRFLHPSEVDLSDINNPKIRIDGSTPNISFEKMSKSKHNGIDPAQCIAEYGADATRAHMLFAAPVSEVLEWDPDRIVGIQRWYQRVWRLCQPVENVPSAEGLALKEIGREDTDLWLFTQKTISSVTQSLEIDYTLNTVVSDLIKLTNKVIETQGCSASTQYAATNALLRMMAPVAPAFSEECWENLHSKVPVSASSVLEQPFPEVDHEALNVLSSSHSNLTVQINGKKRLVIEVPALPSTIRMGPDSDEYDEEVLRAWLVEQLTSNEESAAQLGPGGKWQLNLQAAKFYWKLDGNKVKTVNIVSSKGTAKPKNEHPRPAMYISDS